MEPDVNSKCHYAVLGVKRTASEAELSTAYKRLAMKYHPDKNLDDKEGAETAFKKVKEAYEFVTSDAAKEKAAEEKDPFRKVNQAALDRLLAEARRGTSVNGQQSGTGQGASCTTNTQRNAKFPQDNFAQEYVPPASPPASPAMNLDDCAEAMLCFRVPIGMRAVVRKLLKAPEHNGKVGKIVAFDDENMRYKVQVDENTAFSLRRQNFTQVVRVQVEGLEGKRELNGLFGEVHWFDEKQCRYKIQFDELDPPASYSLKLSNCILPQDTRVILQGLTSQQYNGQLARIISVDQKGARYVVECFCGKQMKVKYDKVQC
eukprot:TRINITY_DN29391_c0_g1_i1.p1 TRINITY_DN29391_c0_g1~~TRINITY_DN29391_c0_g1_i1.p1  ORF type:complete len:317 (+),score=61.81 TRINITY_DN29391_c0_g1_i1:68-1018(+)